MNVLSRPQLSNDEGFLKETIADQIAKLLFEHFKRLSQQKAAPLVVCQEDNTASGAASY